MTTQKKWKLWITLGLLASMASCSSAQIKKDSTEQSSTAAETNQNQMTELRSIVAGLESRMEFLKNRMVMIDEKFESTRISLENVLAMTKPKSTPVIPNAAEDVGLRAESVQAASDPEAGFTNDHAVQSYRQAMILFQAQKYPEAVLAFTTFLDAYPDHALAGAAQFYVGEAYFKQKEYKLALQEFNRVLTSYDRSSHIAETLKQMATAELALKRTDDSARHRQLLTSLFPQSPAALAKVATVSQKTETPMIKPVPEAKMQTPPEAASLAPLDDFAPPTAPLDSPKEPAPAETPAQN